MSSRRKNPGNGDTAATENAEHTILRRASLTELAAELERLRATARDVVADTRDLVMADDLTLTVPQVGKVPLTDHAHVQIAEKCGIPYRYYQAMREAGKSSLVAENVNDWMGTKADRRLVRVADGRVRGVLSDRYRVMDSYDLVSLAAQEGLKHNVQVLDCTLTETKLFLRMTVPHYQETLRGGEVGDIVIPGLILSNSEVGDGAFAVEPLLYRLRCKNGMIGENTLRRVHVGAKMGDGEQFFTDTTRQMTDAAMWAQVADVIRATFDPAIFRGLVDALNHAKDVPVREPAKVIDAAIHRLALPEARRDALLGVFGREGHNLFGLTQSLTEIAQLLDNPSDQVRVERYAGELLTATPAALEAEYSLLA